jgi:hypothetical protein
MIRTMNRRAFNLGRACGRSELSRPVQGPLLHRKTEKRPRILFQETLENSTHGIPSRQAKRLLALGGGMAAYKDLGKADRDFIVPTVDITHINGKSIPRTDLLTFLDEIYSEKQLADCFQNGGIIIHLEQAGFCR